MFRRHDHLPSLLFVSFGKYFEVLVVIRLANLEKLDLQINNKDFNV
jgi:hypothetical protein